MLYLGTLKPVINCNYKTHIFILSNCMPNRQISIFHGRVYSPVRKISAPENYKESRVHKGSGASTIK